MGGNLCRTIRWPATAGSAAAIVLAAASCDLSASRHYEDRLLDTGEPALHAVHNDRLQEIMGDLDRLAAQSDGYDTPLEFNQKHNESLKVAEALVASAGRLPDLMMQLDLDEAEQRIYLSWARRLHGHAERYRAFSERRNLDEMSRTLEQMTATCNACHSTFRKM